MDTCNQANGVNKELYASSSCKRYPDDKEGCKTKDVKIEDFDASEQYIDQNGDHNRKTLIVKSENDYLEVKYQQSDIDVVIGTHQQYVEDTKISEFSVKREDKVDLMIDKCYPCKYGVESEMKLVKSDVPSEQTPDLCDYDSCETTTLKQHIDTVHSKSKQHECTSCDFSTNRKSNLKRHVDSVHLNLKQRKCQLCDYATNDCTSLKSHIDSMHFNLKKHKSAVATSRSKRTKTDIDSDNFSSKQSNHLDTVHSNLKRYECYSCDFTSSRKPNLKRHIDSVHLNLKQHKCDSCEYASNDTGTLKKHIDNVHLNLKKQKCHLCDYACTCKTHLKYHINSIHLNIKEQMCSYCDYATNRKNDLKQHIDTVHLRLKPHMCTSCDFSTNHKYNLKRHMDSVHSVSQQ